MRIVVPDVKDWTAVCSSASVETGTTLPLGGGRGGALHARLGAAEAATTITTNSAGPRSPSATIRWDVGGVFGGTIHHGSKQSATGARSQF